MKRKITALGLVVLAGLACSNRRDRNVIAASGTIEAVEVNVASKVAGQILALAVEEGARVGPGDVLATVDHATADIQLRQAEAGRPAGRSPAGPARQGSAERGHPAGRGRPDAGRFGVQGRRRTTPRGCASSSRRGASRRSSADDAEARLTVATAQRSAAAESAWASSAGWHRPEEIQAAEARLAQARAGRRSPGQDDRRLDHHRARRRDRHPQGRRSRRARHAGLDRRRPWPTSTASMS